MTLTPKGLPVRLLPAVVIVLVALLVFRLSPYLAEARMLLN